MAQKHSSVDLTQWAVQRIGELTDSGYNEIVAWSRTKDSAEKLARYMYGPRWRKHVYIAHRSGIRLAQNDGYTPSTVKTDA